MSPRRRAAVLALTLSAGLVACGPAAPLTTVRPSAQPSPSPSVSVPDLVGEWERDTQCQEIVKALREAGMEAAVPVYASSFIPAGQISVPSQPCEGAIPLRHSHFFTADGRFGSRDENGNQVDDGTYRIVDDSTFVISNYLGSDTLKEVTFHYVISGDTIAFDPVIPDCRPDCFESIWSVTVAYPGQTWTRVAR